MEFDGRSVMVTGATGNLGRAVADAFAAGGARLALIARDPAKLDALYGPADETRLHLRADLADGAALTQAAADAVARFGAIDALAHVAGGFAMGDPVHETADDVWERMMDMNARATLNIARAVVPHMLAAGRGAIVTVGAVPALKAPARMGAYAASKAAVIRLTEAMSDELRAKGVNVNCVLPSIIDTPENRAAMPDADPAKWVAPADLAAVIRFLASDAARAVHGAAIPVVGLS